MTGTVNQGLLLDKLLKTRYPLTYYLIRQQEFVKAFSTISTNTLSTSVEPKTNKIHRRKEFLSDTKVPQASKVNNLQNRFNDDQDYYTTHDQSSETDDDDTQEYDARPLIKNIRGQHYVKK